MKETKEILIEIARPSCFGDSETIIDCKKACGMVGECARQGVKKLIDLGLLRNVKPTIT